MTATAFRFGKGLNAKRPAALGAPGEGEAGREHPVDGEGGAGLIRNGIEKAEKDETYGGKNRNGNRLPSAPGVQGAKAQPAQARAERRHDFYMVINFAAHAAIQGQIGRGPI